MANYVHQTKPFIVPVPDNKIIREHFGHASVMTGNYSIAHMKAPPQWSEPFQNPAFDEVTLMIRGKKKIEVDGNEIILSPGESILIKKGARVRYSNPFPEENEYVSFCIPAFTIDTVHREDA